MFLFFVAYLLVQTLIIAGAAKPSAGLLLLFDYLATIGLVLLSYWVWRMDADR